MNALAQGVIKNFLAGTALVSQDLEVQRQFNILMLAQRDIAAWIKDCQKLREQIEKQETNSETVKERFAVLDQYLLTYEKIYSAINQRLTALSPSKA